MPITYRPLWETMALKHISTYYLINHGISKATIDRLKHDRPVTTNTVALLCEIIGCQPGDILKYRSE